MRQTQTDERQVTRWGIISLTKHLYSLDGIMAEKGEVRPLDRTQRGERDCDRGEQISTLTQKKRVHHDKSNRIKTDPYRDAYESFIQYSKRSLGYDIRVEWIPRKERFLRLT